MVYCNELLIEESLLTGESQAIQKDEQVVHTDAHDPGDQVNMAIAATTVLKGRGSGLVVQTGISAEIGKIASYLTTTRQEKPPLVNRMDVFSKNIGVAVMVICTVLGLVGYLRGMPAIEIFYFMVAACVPAIPEGLPVALTVALAIGTNRMAMKNVIVRRLPAVEGLGSCTLIASDKTGTLTMDQQSVKEIYLLNGKDYLYPGMVIMETESFRTKKAIQKMRQMNCYLILSQQPCSVMKASYVNSQINGNIAVMR